MTTPHPTRREFVQGIAGSLLGVSLAPHLALSEEKRGSSATADHVIYLFMTGGMSHLDTFDLRPDHPEIQGPVKGISTKVPGVQVTEHLPLLARQMEKLAQVRSLYHSQGNHEPGQYHMKTGYDQGSRVIAHPALGAWVTKQANRISQSMPPYVRVGDLGGHPSNGFFSANLGPLPVSSAESGLQNSRLRDGVDPSSFQSSLDLVSKFDRRFRGKYKGSTQVAAYSELYTEAVRLMSSKDLEGFDISKEPFKTREAYGDTPFGSGCLLARRLVERGVRFVEVDLGGWDSHTDNHKQVADNCGKLDRPLSTLLTDLQTRGLLERTLVVVATEFGRSPGIDQFAGRNHNPFGYTSLLAGGGVAGGTVYGKTNANGKGVAKDQVSAQEFNATIAHALGLDVHHMERPGPGGQWFSIGGKDTAPQQAQPIAKLFS